MSPLPAEISAALAPRGRTLLITIGNPLRADDGVGPYVGERVRFRDPEHTVINAGTTPENVAQRAIDLRPDKIILLDAARFGGAPGECRVIPLEDISRQTVLSTHSFPLGVTFSIVREDTGAELTALGIEPGSMEFGEGLSPEVERTAAELISYFNSL